MKLIGSWHQSGKEVEVEVEEELVGGCGAFDFD
jgi:hypothetical protein